MGGAHALGDTMATILEFRSAPRPTAASALAAHSELSAEIVFFPGVRYERQDEADDAGKGTAGKRRRDTLELES